MEFSFYFVYNIRVCITQQKQRQQDYLFKNNNMHIIIIIDI
jgi:hypothetical protein